VAAGGLLVCFLALAASYAAHVPPWEAPDEVAHFEYAAHLARTRTLPVQRLGQLGESHQPPLYYALAGLAAAAANLDDTHGTFRPNPRFMWGHAGDEINAGLNAAAGTVVLRGQALALRLARATSTLMGLATVALTIAIGWRVFPTTPAVGLVAGALVAFNPQFLFISAAVNNDNLLCLASTGALLQFLRALARQQEVRQWLFLGAWLTAALLAKTTGLLVCVVLALALVVVACRRRSARLLATGSAALLLPAIGAGWWLIRNYALYGDPLGWTVYQQVFAVEFRASPLRWHELPTVIATQFRSFWGVFGWMNVSAPEWFYAGATALCVAAALGLLWLGVTRLAAGGGAGRIGAFRPVVELRRVRPALLVLGGLVVTHEALLLALATRCDASCYQGRYLFPVIAPAMVLASLGLAHLPLGRLRGPAFAGLLAALLASAASLPVTTIAAAYPPATVPAGRLRLVDVAPTFSFGSTFELASYTLDVDDDESRVTVTLYWRALARPDFDYSVFVHLVDDADRLVAQQDHAPGARRRYPPSSWLAGDVVADEHEIVLPAGCPPGTYRLRLGVYNWATGERLPVRFGAAGSVGSGDTARANAPDALTLPETVSRPAHLREGARI
jgi:4-amino-4-deoxy-L-arabinose transferase-like glycosyltransferase